MATGRKKTAVRVKQNTKGATEHATQHATQHATEHATRRGTKRVSAPVKGKPRTQSARSSLRSDKDVAISTELAPAVAIALLEQAHHGSGQPTPALEPLAAGAVSSDADGKVRVQLLFENGAVLPVEMTDAAAQALGKGIAKELQKS